MLVRELMAILADEHPESVVVVEGICPHGGFMHERDISVTFDQGPTDETLEIVVEWTNPESDRMYASMPHDPAPVRTDHFPASHPARNGDLHGA